MRLRWPEWTLIAVYILLEAAFVVWLACVDPLPMTPPVTPTATKASWR